MAQPSVFGQIAGIAPGHPFDSREDVRAAGLHRHLQGGISGDPDAGADAIVVSGGYKDDEDYGDRIVYTGQGGRDAKGRQVKDQVLTKGNLALARSEESGFPVRVVRGAHKGNQYAPKEGYSYDGLYVVTKHWQEASVDGPLIWRYELQSADGGQAWDSTPIAPPPPGGAMAPARKTSVVQRVVRNSAVTQWVKDLHKGACQFCGLVLETAAGFYAEGAHIRALGSPHNGPDTSENVLCLCPNDHVLFDKGALFLADGEVRRTSDGAVLGSLRTHPAHEIEWAHAAYHREHFAEVV